MLQPLASIVCASVCFDNLFIAYTIQKNLLLQPTVHNILYRLLIYETLPYNIKLLLQIIK